MDPDERCHVVGVGRTRGCQANVRLLVARDALREEVARVVELLRSVSNPGAHAVGEWSLIEVAMHLSQAWLVVPGLARQDTSEAYELFPGLERRHGGSLIGDLWELAAATAEGVGADHERDPWVLADRIESRAGAFLDGCAGHSPFERRPWLVEGVEVPLPVLTGHLLNETVAHGNGLAVADGRRWEIIPAHAATVFDAFLVPMLSALPPRTMVDQQRAAGFHACYDVRIRGGRRYVLIFDDGRLTVDTPSTSTRRIDCHLSVDPVAFLLLTWNRIGQWGAIGRGKLVAWGRQPWLGPRLRSLLRNP